MLTTSHAHPSPHHPTHIPSFSYRPPSDSVRPTYGNAYPRKSRRSVVTSRRRHAGARTAPFRPSCGAIHRADTILSTRGLTIPPHTRHNAAGLTAFTPDQHATRVRHSLRSRLHLRTPKANPFTHPPPPARRTYRTPRQTPSGHPRARLFPLDTIVRSLVSRGACKNARCCFDVVCDVVQQPQRHLVRVRSSPDISRDWTHHARTHTHCFFFFLYPTDYPTPHIPGLHAGLRVPACRPS